MSTGTVFVNNRTQAVRIPAELRLPEGIKQVIIRARGNERIITPVSEAWNSFFIDGPAATADFMDERASQQQAEREALQ